MGSIKNINKARNMSQQEKDVHELEVLDDYINTLLDYADKRIKPRLPPNSFDNIRLALGLQHIK